jgi:hypothetical protein
LFGENNLLKEEEVVVIDETKVAGCASRFLAKFTFLLVVFAR